MQDGNGHGIGSIESISTFNTVVHYITKKLVRTVCPKSNCTMSGYTVKPRYTVQLGSRGFERYAVWKRYIASSLINHCKRLNQLFSLSITT